MAESIEFSFLCGEFPESTFAVLGFEGTEGISQLYRFDIDLVSEDRDIDIDDLQDQPSTLRMVAGGRERRVQGIVSQVEVLDQAGEYTVYRVALVPRVWELTLGTASAVHLDQTTPEVIRAALEQQLGITSADFNEQLDESAYRSWPFRLQYGESHWSFLSRLMERDGIYYYFTAGDEVERIAFCDSCAEQPRLEDASFRYSPVLGIDPDIDGHTVDSFVMRQRRVPRRVTVQNYNDDTPSTPIQATETVDERGTGAVHLYGQTVLDPDEARRIAGIRAQELLWPKVTFEGESTAFELAAAHRFDLTGHAREQNNREYQILRIEHSAYNSVLAGKIGRQKAADTPVYENRFTAIPAERQFRADRRTDWPQIRGTINAVVDARGDGKYAELDEEGRYHIVFPFHEGFHAKSRKDAGKASHWVRMIQPFGGAREGMHMPLRRGTRVLVGFIGGNPDLPVISGTVSTAEHRSVIDSDDATRGRLTTPGGNELETDDNEGRERLRLRSRNSNARLSLGADQHERRGGSSAGASSTEPDETPTADGMQVETSGMYRVGVFGGANYVQTTDAWAITGTLWGDTRQQRDQELAHDDMKDLSELHRFAADDNEWTIADGPKRIFAFPRKHARPADAPDADDSEDALLSDHEEAQGRLHISRKLGEAYEFRSGSTFSFTGEDCEAFEFGPKASFVCDDHETSSEELRAIISNSLPEFKRSTGAADDYTDVEEARRDLAEAEEEYEARLERCRELYEAALARAQNNPDLVDRFDSSSDSTRTSELNKDVLLFNDGADYGEWASLANVPDASDSISEGEEQWYRAIPDNLEPKSPLDEQSVDFARNDYESKLKEYEDDLNKRPDTTQGSWGKKMRKGRVSVKKSEEFRWHTGNIYDFGGMWEYNLGNGYVENHMRQSDADINGKFTYDMLNAGGPEWTSIDVNSSLEDKKLEQASMWVEKSIGDAYEYRDGTLISVHVGASQERRKGSPRIEEVYSADDHCTLRERVDDGVTETWRSHPKSGAALFYERSTWGVEAAGAGKNTFTTEFAPSLSMEIKADFTQSTSIRTGISVAIDVDVGFRSEVSMHVGGKSKVDLFAGIEHKTEASSSMVLELSLSTMHLGSVNGGIDIKVPGAKLSKPQPTELEQRVALLESAQAQIRRSTISLSSGFQMNA